MKSILYVLPLMLLISLPGCDKENNDALLQPKQIILPAKADQVIRMGNDFGIDLFTKVSAVEEGNLMLSPLSATAALTMLLNGCEEDTYFQIRDMLGFDEFSISEINATYQSLVGQLLEVDPDVDLALANAVWYRQDFQVNPPYLDTMHSIFTAHTEALDFQLPSAVDEINNWASDNTNGRIPKVMDEISDDAVMFLMNALYFKGTWTYKFDENMTSQKGFLLDDGSLINVEMMESEIIAKTLYTDSYSVVELPYGRQNFAMAIIVPNAPLPLFIGQLTPGVWNTLITSLDEIEEESKIMVQMPRFRFDFEKILNDQLKSLGMTDAFEPGLANLSGISNADIYVSFVQQNTFVEVNENGTEAAAVTTIGINYTSVPESFSVNKPFIFAIREKTTNTLLFIGKVMHPEY